MNKAKLQSIFEHPKLKAASLEWQLEQLVDVAENGTGASRVKAVALIRDIQMQLTEEEKNDIPKTELPKELLKRIEDAEWTSKETDVTQ